MEEALSTAIHATNFVKSHSVNDRFFVQFCEDEISKPYCFTQKQDGCQIPRP